MQTRVPNLNYKCGKCGHAECELVQLRSSGGFLSAAFNLQNQRFTAVVCVRCKFSELYHGKASVFQQAADFLIGG
ncbi:GTP-binding protein [Stenotrophobium rhamnosiphilum]|uniref:GTP-binding protein n=2 Tax=Stenotrophobium rhamnosiphilum TaxID=2029166 RepID=A0A2T5MBP8_9GAMM|nr:GTP-binding protein [Stenotrophobium rhamnosiphilum]